MLYFFLNFIIRNRTRIKTVSTINFRLIKISLHLINYILQEDNTIFFHKKNRFEEITLIHNGRIRKYFVLKIRYKQITKSLVKLMKLVPIRRSIFATMSITICNTLFTLLLALYWRNTSTWQNIFPYNRIFSKTG